jgi:hypothetical protein
VDFDTAPEDVGEVRETGAVLFQLWRLAMMLAEQDFVVEQSEQDLGVLVQTRLLRHVGLDQTAFAGQPAPALVVQQRVEGRGNGPDLWAVACGLGHGAIKVSEAANPTSENKRP